MSFSAQQQLRYARQTLLPEVGSAGQEKLAAGRILVIGAGGLGSAALMYLAAAGVGTLGIADHDRIELSNLARQIIHRTSDLGMMKTESAEKTVRALNPDVKVQTFGMRITSENISGVIRDFDMILDCTDRFESKLLINDACVLSGKPFVHGGVLRSAGQIMTWLPGPGPCLRCMTGETTPSAEAETCAVSGVLGPAAGVIGSLQAMEAVKFLLGKGELLTGRVLHFDGMSMTFTETVVPERSPYCPVCGSSPADGGGRVF